VRAESGGIVEGGKSEFTAVESPKLSDRHIPNYEPLKVAETGSSDSVTLGLLLGSLESLPYAGFCSYARL